MLASADLWRWRLFLVAIIAATVTPPDVIAMLVVLVPLFAAGEVVALVGRRWGEKSCGT
jgi:Sec-independent protein secretion pathway component TatC